MAGRYRRGRHPAPRELNHLKIQRDGAGGQLLYPELRTGSPTIHNWPVFTTTSIPSNLGGSGDESPAQRHARQRQNDVKMIHMNPPCPRSYPLS